MIRSFLFHAICAFVTVLPAHSQLVAGKREAATSAPAAYVVADATTGVVLESSNANRSMQIGSITKIAMAMVVLDWAAGRAENLSQTAIVPATIGALESPNSIGLETGDEISLRDALYASLMQSDNQAAETLAVHVGRKLGGGPSDREAADFFTAQMNALARKLGMRDTKFLNAHGLDDLEQKLPSSTAADVAKLTNYALGHSGFTFYTSQRERKITWQTEFGDTSNYTVRNTNEALGQMGIDGVKTGTTRKSGPCVVISAAQRPDSKQVGDEFFITPRRLTVVVLGCGTRFDTAKALLSRGWRLHDQWTAAGRPTKGWKPGVASR
jgi:serine-type D-Ala-D-Ala carboxypeptidase (penicillin-binding protein 5/6)